MTSSDFEVERTCGALRGFDEETQFSYPGPPPYLACDDVATHVEIEDDGTTTMRVYLCAKHAGMWARHDPSWSISPLAHVDRDPDDPRGRS